MINAIEIDSFKIRIPFDVVKIINESLLYNFVYVNEGTGEVLPEIFKSSSLPVYENGITIRYAIEKQMTADKTVKKFVVILINAKILKELYFDGITEGNIGIVYQGIISQKIIEIDFSDFLSGEITDVDFKQDRIFEYDFIKTIKRLYEISKEYKELNKGARLFNKKNNQGLEFSQRSKASDNYPYLKIYNKYVELSQVPKSKEFFEAYIFNQVPDHNYLKIGRVEFTVKNKRHFRKYDVEFTSLEYILSLNQEQKLKILKDYFDIHLHIKKHKQAVKKMGELKANQRLIKNLIEMLLEFKSYAYIRTYIFDGFTNKSQLIKKRAELDQLVKKHIESLQDKKVIEQEIEISEFLSMYFDEYL